MLGREAGLDDDPILPIPNGALPPILRDRVMAGEEPLSADLDPFLAQILGHYLLEPAFEGAQETAVLQRLLAPDGARKHRRLDLLGQAVLDDPKRLAPFRFPDGVSLIDMPPPIEPHLPL